MFSSSVTPLIVNYILPGEDAICVGMSPFRRRGVGFGGVVSRIVVAKCGWIITIRQGFVVILIKAGDLIVVVIPADDVHEDVGFD